MKKEKLFYLYVVLGFILNIFIFPIGGLNFLKNALTALTSLDNNVEVKKVVIESDGYADKTPGSWHMEKSADWTSTTNAKIVFDVDTNPSFHRSPNFDVIMVLDVSGSMSGTKLTKLKDSAKKYVNDILNSSVDNTISLIEYSSDSSIVTPFVNDVDTLITDIDGLVAGGNTNYYAGLKKVEEQLTDYKISQDRGLVVLFMTDGAANEDTSMIKSQYEYLKDKYPSIKIVGIQYEMGSKITSYLKQASDVQYDAYVDDIYDHFYEATFNDTLNYYEKFEIIDYISNDYFEVISEDDIKVSIGSVKLETNESSQKVIWTVESDTLITSANSHMEISVKLKKDCQKQAGYYPTNKKVEVTTKLPDEEEKHTESDETPVLKYGYTVYYDGNYPSDCDLTYDIKEDHYWYESVELSGIPPVCEGYRFNGWKVKTDVTWTGDNRFIMPNYDVYVKGIWSKTELVKSTEGTIFDNKLTFYQIIKNQAIPDNIKSAYVASENGINFKYNSSDTNGKGVYMIADTANDEYPIYYYRGKVTDNNVLFADLCWQIIRTTETGGIKLIYNGTPTIKNNKKICNNKGDYTSLEFNENGNSPAYVGYKYGTVYEYNTKSRPITNKKMLPTKYLSGEEFVYFSTTVDYKNGQYELGSDKKQYPWNNNWNKLKGYYTCGARLSTSCREVCYIVNSSTSVAYCSLLTGGTLPEDVDNMIFGKSIQDNGNGTYTLKNTVNVKKSNWYDKYSSYSGYYICGNDLTSDTCNFTDIHYITETYSDNYYSFNVEKMKYGKSFTYDNETKQYTLTDPIEVFSPQAVEKDLATHHYTCLDDTDTCTSINYVYSISSTTNTYNSVLYYIPLTGGKNVETALAEMFKSEHDSIIKDYLEDDWYVNHITDYEKYLEDTVWCNDRSYEDSKVNSGWNPNGGGMSQYLYFDTYYRFKNGTPSLKCKEKDSLTVANGGASKPIGLLTSDEAIYAGVSNSASSDYYIGGKGLMMSPYYFDRTDSTLFQMWSGSLSYTSSSSTNNIRPVVSLRYGAAWDGGDGTSEDPYVVMTG